MGKHVDTTRPEDAYTLATFGALLYPRHRKPGPPSAPLGHRTFLDPWAGNPDTDRVTAQDARWVHISTHIPAIDFTHCDMCTDLVYQD